MKSIKIIKSFFNKTSAKAQAKFENQLAIENGSEIVEVKVMDACQMYVSNCWYKSKIREFGWPKPGQLIVVVFYAKADKVAVVNKSGIALNKVIEIKPEAKPGQLVSTDAAIAKVILINLAMKNNTHLLRGTRNVIEFKPDYNLSLAA